MSNPNPLIRTKLRPPFTRPELVPRPRLQQQIALGLRGPLTLVTAPAGFGKTTLVASCAAGCGMPVAWLSLDNDDNQPGRFLTYLIAAIQAADQRIGAEAAQLIAGIQPAQPEAVLTSLINDLDGADTEMILVLDDYHLISSPLAHEQVTFLLEHCPGALHLVISTRSDPPLPLARLRARGLVIELRAADLRFTAGEAVHFLNEVMGLRLDARAVAILEERTEGWIAGLQMAALSVRDRKDITGFIQGFSGTNRYILDYLVEEVLASQPAEIQEFLLKTSILERLSAGLCEAVYGERWSVNGEETPLKENHSPLTVHRLPTTDNCQPILDYLERENLFLISLDDGWYRYHHLFADLLRVRLRQADAGLVPKLHARASAWLEQNGFIAEAIQHLFAANEVDRAAGLIERYGPARWAESDPSVVLLADRLPSEMLLARPKVGIYQGWLLIIQGHIERSLRLLNDLAHHLTANPHSGQPWMRTMIGLALAFLGQRAGNPGFDPFPDDEILDEVPAEEHILRDTAIILYGMTLARRGEIDRAADFAVRRLQREQVLYRAARQNALAIPTLVAFMARVFMMQGRLHQAASLCREYLIPIHEKGIRFIYNAGSMNVVLGEALYEWNRTEEAEQQIREGMRANEPWMDIMTEAFDQIALARVLVGKGEYAGAMQVVETFENKLRVDLRPHEFEEDLRTLRVRVQLASGDLQSASVWADQIQRSEEFQRRPELYRLTLASIRLAQGRYAEVEALLAGAPLQNEADNRVTRQLRMNLLLAAATAAAVAGQGRMPETASQAAPKTAAPMAIEIIDSALALAEPEGYIRVFIEMGEPARELLMAYLKSADPGHKAFAQRLLGAFPPINGIASPGPQTYGLVEPLTEREMEVLQLMALGQTNQEIARKLVVASGTIKAHAASIYRKLDAANRTEAVAKAREMGFFDDCRGG